MFKLFFQYRLSSCVHVRTKDIHELAQAHSHPSALQGLAGEAFPRVARLIFLEDLHTVAGGPHKNIASEQWHGDTSLSLLYTKQLKNPPLLKVDFYLLINNLESYR